MTDIATLGLAVDSRQLAEGNKQLDNFVSRAGNAQGASDKLAGSHATLTQRFREIAEWGAIIPGKFGEIGARAAGVLGIMDRFGVAGGAAALTLGAIGVASEKSIEAFADLEKEQLTYNAVLKATQGAAGQTGNDIEELAHHISRSAGVTEGSVREAASSMLTFKNVSGETFTRAMELSADLAAVMGGGLANASFALGRALDNPAQGLTMLRRAGIALTQTQQDMIKRFMETGQVANAQKVILDEVQARVGGAGASVGGGLSGSFAKLGESINNSLEYWGGLIVKGTNLKGIIDGIASSIDHTNKLAEHSTTPETRLDIAQGALTELNGRSAVMKLPGDDAQRARILREIADAQQQLNDKELGEAMIKGQVDWNKETAQRQAQKNVVDGVAIALGREIDMIQRSNLGREIEIELRKAEVEALSVEGMAIAKLVIQRHQLAEGARDAQARVSALGAAANETEKLAAREKELNDQVRAGVISINDRARAMTAAKLESQISIESRRIGILEQSATVDEVVAQKQRDINLLAQQNITFTKEQTEAILTRTRIQAEAARLGGPNGQIAFDRSQLGRDQYDQQAASAVRSAGKDMNSAEGQLLAQQLRLNGLLLDGKNTAVDFFGGMAKDIAHGVKPLDALESGLGRVRDKLIDMATNSLVSKAFGALLPGINTAAAKPVWQASSGGLFGGAVIPGVLHAGGLGSDAPSYGRSIDTSYFVGAQRFHKGKAPWDSATEMPAIINKNEEVITTKDPRHSWNGGGDSGEFHYHDNRTYQDVTPDLMSKLEARIRQERPYVIQEAIKSMRKQRGSNPNLYSPG